MEIDPGDLMLFARIVECGSFSLAAERVQLPKSTVSRRISLLEAHLGERLLQRTTRKLVLTEFGASLLEHARRVADETEAAGALAQHRQGAPSGLLRVSMPADFANAGVGEMLAQFMHRYPAISLELDLSPRRQRGVVRQIAHADRQIVVLRHQVDPARRITFSSLALYASPSYTGLRGLPEHPDDLFKHDLLSLPPRVNGLIRWTLLRGKTRWERELPVRLLGNSPEMIVRMTGNGVGIGVSTEAIAAPFLRAGTLVRVLPEWSFPQVTGWAVFPGRRLMPAKTRVFLDMLEAAFDRRAD